ncbi:MAG: hypothetical protein ACI4AW_05190 [Paludibacteraceae bacterium]
MKNAIVKHMSVNQQLSPFMNRCRLFAILLLLACALPAIGQTTQTTYTYVKSKGKSQRDLQTAPSGKYQMQAVHEDRVVIYRKPSPTPFWLWRNAEAFITYVRWYDYTTDQSIPNIQLWKSRINSNKTDTIVQTDTLRTDNHGVMWYTSDKKGNPFQANAKYIYNPGPADKQVTYVACDQSFYTDWTVEGTNFTEPTLSQRMVFEIHPASEMAARVDSCAGSKWLEEYDIMAPTNQNIYLGPKYAFLNAEIKSGNYKGGYNNVVTSQTYPAYFYTIGNAVQSMASTQISNPTGSSSTIGTWQNVPTSTKSDSSTIYICDSNYVINSTTWNLQASQFSNTDSDNDGRIEGDVIIDGLTWHYKRMVYKNNGNPTTLVSPKDTIIEGVPYVRFGDPASEQTKTSETLELTMVIPAGVIIESIQTSCFADGNSNKLHFYVDNSEIDIFSLSEKKNTNGKNLTNSLDTYFNSYLISSSARTIRITFEAKTRSCALYIKSIKLDVKDSSTDKALTGKVDSTSTEEPCALVARFWRKIYTKKEYSDYTKTDVLTTGGSGWIWFEDGAMPAKTPTVTSGQYVNVGTQSTPTTKTYQLVYADDANTNTSIYTKTECTETKTTYVYDNGWVPSGSPNVQTYITKQDSSSQDSSLHKIYKIAQFKVHYFDKNIVGPVSQKMGDFVNNMELIAEQNFNFGYSENNKIPSGTSKQFWTTPLPTKESTYSFFYGESSQSDRASSIGNRKFCYYNEYQFVNNGCGWGNNESNGEFNSQLANHVGNDKGVNKEAGFALYADGSQKAGTIFSIDFGAELCPGAKMYFTAWIGDLRRDASYTDGRPIFNFYVEGTDAQGNTKTLATFTTGEFANNGNFGWHYILFPLEFADDIDYEKFSFRIENMAATTANNDFFLDDVRVYLQRASISPIQASISNDPSCLVSNGTMMLYTRVDYGTDQIELEKTNETTRSFYYRWYDKDGHPMDKNSVLYYNEAEDAQGHAYGKVSIPLDPNQILPTDTSLNFQVFDNLAAKSTDNALYKFVEEQCLNPDLTVDTRYVVYVATPVHVHLGQSYRCILSNAVSSLPVRSDSVTGEEKCTSDAIVSIVHGLCIRSEKLGGLVVDESQANANISYELSLVSESIKHGESITNKSVSCYYGFWLFGRDIQDGEYNAQKKRQELEALYGASFGTVRDAIIAYIGKVSLGNTTVACSPDQINLVNRLVSIGALKLSNCSLKTDTSFLVLPLYTSDTISYTVFPVWDLGGKGTQCHNPIDISLYFQNKSTPIEGDEGEEQTFIRNAISFVKSADEQLPKFMHNLRARRVRIPTDSIGKYVQIKMTDTSSKYTVKNATLIETTNTNTTAVEPLFKRTESWVDTDSYVKDMTGDGPFRVHFKDLNLLPEGYSYTFRMDYDIRDINPATKLDTTYNGEAFITFMVVPDILYYVGTISSNSNTFHPWNDDTKWQYYDSILRKKVQAMVPLPTSKVVLNNNFVVRKGIEQDQLQSQGIAVEKDAQPYITFDMGYEPYSCSEIFLPYSKYFVGQQFIHTIESGDTLPPKWTYEMRSDANKWRMTSVPIKGVVLGDIYTTTRTENSVDNNPFAVHSIDQTVGEKAVDRTQYSFYNSLYNKAIKQYLGNGDSLDITSSAWTYATNSLTYPIDSGLGWALGAFGNYYIRLPKKDTVYHYFRNDIWVKDSVKIERDANHGRSMFVPDKDDQMTITLHNNTRSNIFIFGNPAFGILDLRRFKAKNNYIDAFYLDNVDKDSRYGLAANIISDVSQSTWYSNVFNNNKTKTEGQLYPTKAIIIRTTQPLRELPLVIESRMFCDEKWRYDGAGVVWDAKSAPAHPDLIEKEPSAIYISATLGDFMSSTSIIDAPDAELELFMLDREKTPFAIYTVADNKALSINHIREGQSRIPLAMYAEKPVNQPLFAFEGEPRDLVEWDLVDIKTGVRQPLYEGLTMRLNMPQDGSVRYYLERSRHGIYTSESKTDAFQTYAYGGMLTIYSEEPLYDLRIYDPAGRLLCMEADAGTSYTATLTAGTYIIRASGSTCKVIVP